MVSDPGRGRDGGDDDEGTGDAPALSDPAFSEEGARRIIYGRGRKGDSRSEAFDEDTAELEAGLRERRSLVPIVTALAAVFCFGAIVWYAYIWGTGQIASEELPVVRAEPMPEKVKPEQPGGMDVPHQDKLVLNDGAPAGEEAQVERLLPAPEIPLPPEPLAEAVPDAQEAPTEANETSEAPPAAEAVEAAPPVEAAETPDAAAETAESGTPGIATPVPKPESPAAEGGDQIAELLEQQPVETTNGNAEAAAKAVPQAPTQTAALTEGDVVLQLSSVKSEAAATKEWARLQGAHPEQLGARRLSLETAEVKGTTYYRVQTGPFPSRAAAGKVCAQLKARNQDCLVTQR